MQTIAQERDAQVGNDQGNNELKDVHRGERLERLVQGVNEDFCEL